MNKQVCILIVRDRSKQTVDFVTGNGPINTNILDAYLKPVLDLDVLLVSDGNHYTRVTSAGSTASSLTLKFSRLNHFNLSLMACCLDPAVLTFAVTHAPVQCSLSGGSPALPERGSHPQKFTTLPSRTAPLSIRMRNSS